MKVPKARAIVDVRIRLLLTLFAIVYSTGCSGGAVDLSKPPLTTQTVSKTAILGANGTTIVVAGPMGVTSTLTLPPVSIGAGIPVTVTLSVGTVMNESSERRRSVPAPTQEQAQAAAISLGTTFDGKYAFVYTVHADEQAAFQATLTVPTSLLAPYGGNEQGLVNTTWSAGSSASSSCSADLSESDAAGTGTNHDATIFSNVTTVNPASGNDGTLQTTIDIGAAPSTAGDVRKRFDSFGGSCSGTSSDFYIGAMPTPIPTATPLSTATPTPTAAPSTSPVPTATPLGAPTPTPVPTHTPASSACTGNNGSHLYVNDDTAGLVRYSLPITSASMPTYLNTTNYNVWLTFDPACNLYLTQYFSSVNEYLTPYTGAAVASYAGASANDPYGVVVNAAGNVFVAEDQGNVVIELSGINGSTIATIPVTAPYALALDTSGNLYIGASGGVYVYAPPYAALSQQILAGQNVQGLAFDTKGDLFAGGMTNGTSFIDVLAPPFGSSNAIASISQGLSHPLGLAVDAAGNVYAPNYGNNTITAYAPPYTAAPFATLSGSLPDADAIGP